MTNIDPEYLKDIENEKTFLKEIVEFELGEVKDNLTGVSNELSLMVKVYNEQLDALVKLRYDAEILSYLIISEPMVKEHLDNKGKTIRALNVKRKGISIIRKQISDMINTLKGKISGE